MNSKNATVLPWTVVVICAMAANAQEAFRANYDEARIPHYELPDPLTLANGQKVSDTRTWVEKRRPEILELFTSQVYGRSPMARDDMHFEVTERDESALGGKAVRKQVTVFFSSNKTGPKMDLLIYLPAKTEVPVPTFLGLNFHGNHTIVSDPKVKLSTSWMRSRRKGVVNGKATEAARGTSSSRWAVEMILDRGYGLATTYYGDIDPDFDDGFQNGVHALFYEKGQTRPNTDEWGSIAAWAWGLSRAVDYFETDDDIDHDKIAVMGHSRLGKTSLWAGAQDERFALVISNNSGCGGAALSRRRFGETVGRINDSFPHWFCGNFKKYDRNEDELPVDQHMLVALIAPRPVYIASAQHDQWADPRGEFLSGLHAAPVYRLFGRDGISTNDLPKLDQPVTSTIGYHIRSGGHDVTDFDWKAYLDFADKHLKW